MSDKRGIFGILGLIIIGAIILLVLLGAGSYYYIKNNGLTLSSGNIEVNLKFNNTGTDKPGDIKINETITPQNLSLINQSTPEFNLTDVSNQTNLSN